MSTGSEREVQGLWDGMGVYQGYRHMIRTRREPTQDTGCCAWAGAQGCAPADPPAERQVRGRAPCDQAPARVGVRRGGLRVRGGSAALDVRGPRRHVLVDASSPSVCRHHRCSHQPGSGQPLARRSPGPPCHVGISGHDMLSPANSKPGPALAAACRIRAGWQPTARPIPLSPVPGSPALTGSLSRLSRRAAQDVHSASFWTHDLGLLSQLTALSAPRITDPSGPTRHLHSL